MTTLPAVAEALARRQAEEISVVNRNLSAYRLVVSKAATHEPLLATDADAAVIAAHALKIRPDRLVDDVASYRQALAYEAQMADYTSQSPARHARLAEIKRELEAVERLARDLRAEHHQLLVSGNVWIALRQNRDEIERNFPHLFKDAESLNAADWQRVRA
jgi:hypothetical protein